MIVYTAPLFYAGPDALDIAMGTADAVGRVLAPRFGERLGAYSERLFALHRERNRVLSGLLGLDTVTILCTCLDAPSCHRTTLAGALVRLGADSGGERPRETVPYECMVRLCDRRIDTHLSLCAEHFAVLPYDLQRGLRDHYTENQRYTGLCSPHWMRLMDQAIIVIGESETGLPDYLAEARRQQDKAWHDEMNPPGKRSASQEACRASWEAVLGARDDDPYVLPRRQGGTSAPAACTFDAPAKPAPKAPAKPRKRGGWQFSAGK